ncbi:MAG TPA: translesion error-prone DNA polymerase V autoproteolytic subunit [Flavobacteriales bacterium]|jgi:DNA polymerase V|nr:translesion error-prone DNA polymerase V autoproteolytic subunit [Flavobacteriales bacterium]HHZ97221.1 translesion error-prone DNA polymerase V autoproteolytic subunit [Flavobacteriales bacterium]HIB76174.1 translesion error-prone DNA polymerase V autoproteolytic subunit [Flavobacteriales bacterium]HIN42257.1 translesion error-prone DNA polymerase V autoproteolytic subunit [Flavobacteriales bacterium]HIO15718.1 translesion error-prone DNA polymerase V autoproteolytic subunit [Flavobacterial
MSRKVKLKWCPAGDVAFDAVAFFDEGVQAGFPSPAEDHLDLDLDLSSYLIQHPSATFCCRVEGDSMVGAGIQSGDVIMIDRSLTPGKGSIVLAILDGEFTVKRVDIVDDTLFLIPENPRLKPIEVGEESSFQVWGVVTFVIHKV